MSGEGMNTEVAPGDKASWPWGGGNPSGKVDEVQPHDVTITTHKGNEVKKTGDNENPAVKLDLGSGKSAVKKASELSVEKEGPKHDEAGSAKTSAGGSAQNGEKKGGLEVPAKKGRGKSKSPAPPAKKAEEKTEEKKEEEKKEDPKEPEKKKKKDEPKAAEKKKQEDKEEGSSKPEEKKEEAAAKAEPKKAEPKKTGKKAEPKKEEPKKDEAKKDEAKEPEQKANGEEKKKPGRKPGTAAKAKEDKPKKRAATETGEPRRSKRGKTE